MHRLSFGSLVVACLACPACGGAEKATQDPSPTGASAGAKHNAAAAAPARQSGRAHRASWSGKLVCTYRAGHGWGNIYECAVTRVDGEAPDVIHLQLSVSEAATQGLDEDSLGDHVFRFHPSDRPYGPPSGYVDPTTHVYWTLALED